MARPRTPTNILDARGAFKKDPQRKRHEPKPRGPLGPPPRYFDNDLKKIWREIVKQIPEGVLTKADRLSLEELTKLVHESRTFGTTMLVGRSNLLRTYIGLFGMSPADRARLDIQPEDAKNDFDDF